MDLEEELEKLPMVLKVSLMPDSLLSMMKTYQMDSVDLLKVEDTLLMVLENLMRMRNCLSVIQVLLGLLDLDQDLHRLVLQAVLGFYLVRRF